MLIHALHVRIETHQIVPLAGKQSGNFIYELCNRGIEIHFFPIIMNTIEQIMLNHGDGLLQTIEEEPMGIEPLLSPAEEHGRALIKNCVPTLESTAASTRTIGLIDGGNS